MAVELWNRVSLPLPSAASSCRIPFTAETGTGYTMDQFHPGAGGRGLGAGGRWRVAGGGSQVVFMSPTWVEISCKVLELGCVNYRGLGWRC